MITFLVSDLNPHPVGRMIRRGRRHFPAMRQITYQTAFRRLRVPDGTLVFTDFDLLTDFELDAVGAIATAAEAAGARVLNHPVRALERAAMHKRLHARGLNAVEVTRADDDAAPSRYPVFIRLQGGCEAPDTGLLWNRQDYDATLAAMERAGRPLRGRIAVSFEAAPDEDGYFRKYGAFRIEQHIVPQHILRSRGWHVKRADSPESAAFDAEELTYIEENPHREALLRLLDEAGYQFGRVDYTIRDGTIVLFEVNSNPSFPNLTKAWREGSTRHKVLLARLAEAFETLDEPGGRGHIPFTLNIAIGHNISRGRWNSARRAIWRRFLERKESRPQIGPDGPTPRNFDVET